MRALLVYNPSATTTTPAVIDVIGHALSDELKLEIEATKRRDHASYLAAGAVHEGFDLVIALGGDGTINEVMQGVAKSDVRLGIIAGGSTNVWARTLGLPNDAVEATSVLLAKLRAGEERTVNLGTANGRYFGFNAGYGFDAEAVRYVEDRYLLKRTVRQASFVYCGLLAYFGGYRRRKASITVELPDGERVEGLRTAICCNSNPFTYLWRFSAQLCPQADLDAGLDLTGLTRMGLPTLLRVVQVALSGPDIGRLRSVRLWHDLDGFRLTSDDPLPLQVDGDYVGDTPSVTFGLASNALTVIA